MELPGKTVMVSGTRAFVERSEGLLIPVVHTSRPIDDLRISGKWTPNRHFAAVLRLAIQGRYEQRAKREGYECGICFALAQIDSHGNHEVDNRSVALKATEISAN